MSHATFFCSVDHWSINCWSAVRLFLFYVTVLSWAILPHSWRLHLGIVTFRPWRLLTLVNGVPLLICSVIAGNCVESPKWLLTKNKTKEALDVLAYIYSKNKGKPKETYPVSKPSCSITLLPILPILYFFMMHDHIFLSKIFFFTPIFFYNKFVSLIYVAPIFFSFEFGKKKFFREYNA